ncbi:hypothetical protein MTR67_001280 [Solanum verrucosum]|uniref:DUF4218 domain-containing protein n=1 Tax=Solanum verrucosum TaxID=315347 RepID=A0AAF0PQB4_SOLVR|nr:hypothetical protein MTR67_001280 [Solanum verrucosum]
MHYLPLIPRLKRLYASNSSAPYMRWHRENRRPPGVMCHPSDGEAWKYFDRTYPDFAAEPKNVRLGDDIWERVQNFPKVTEEPPYKFDGYSVAHNWTKQSIFWELPYWKDNLLRHNLDVMHIEKNYFDNLFNTVMDVTGKTKDNVKARLDLPEHCRRPELHLEESANNKLLKPKASYSFTMEQKRKICEWVESLKMPDGYASNLGKRVDIEREILHGMKSHDCHVFMEQLLPIAFCGLPENIWKPMTEISLFFKDLCSSTLRVENLVRMAKNIVVISNKLEKILPPGFFDVMEHLPIHLVHEALLGSPVQYRWMYPFERSIGKSKRGIKNKHRVEGCMVQVYLAKERSHFCSYYYDDYVSCLRNKPNRHDATGNDPAVQSLSIFNQPGKGSKKRTLHKLTEKEKKSAELHVLLNCPEVQPFLDYFVSQYGHDQVFPSFIMWYTNWEKELGRPVAVAEMFKVTHVKKSTNPTEEERWIEPCAQETYDRYIRISQEYRSTLPLESQDRPFTQEENKNLWKQSAGEPIRGSIYGYPEKAYQKKKSWYCGSSSSSFDGGDKETISAMESKIAYLNAELAVVAEREKKREEKERKREEEIAATKKVENKRYAALQSQLTFLFESGNILPSCPVSSDENDKSDKESEVDENGKSDKESESD